MGFVDSVEHRQMIFPDFVDKLHQMGDPFLYVKTIGDAAQDEVELVRSILTFGAFYDIGSTWGLYLTMDKDMPPPLEFFERHERIFKPMSKARRTANTNEKLVRVFQCIYDHRDEILRVASRRSVNFDDFQRLIQNRIWSFGPYFGLRCAYGILRILNPSAAPAKPVLTKHTGRGFKYLTGQDQTMERVVALMEEHGLETWEMGSILCDMKMMVNGDYYPGVHADEHVERLFLMEELGVETADVYTVREQLLPYHLLGEHGGWSGQIPGAMAHYANTGKVWDYWGLANS